MKNSHSLGIISLLICFCLMSFLSVSAIKITENDKRRAEDLLKQMSLEEKISYISGETPFSLRPVERLGIPRILLADGPQGIRNHCDHSTLYPCGIAAAATWNRDLLYLYGQGLGTDCRARGVGILLGPGVNIYRYPLCGRNFEYMGEDPYLASELACKYIEGVQSKGVISTIKHFAGNNQEWNRHHVSSDIDLRALHEIYFPAFRKAINKAGVGAVMNSYNLLNGVHSTENRWLNRDILREMWGFDGILMSDWNSVYSTVNAINSGLDLEMPGPLFFTEDKIKEALENGKISLEEIDRKVLHLLQTLSAFGLLDREQKDPAIALDNLRSKEIALNTARESIVLLKNKDNILPLNGKTVVIGHLADTIVSGGGSGAVFPYSSTPLLKGLKAIDPTVVYLDDKNLYDDLSGSFYTDDRFTKHGFSGSYFDNINLEGRPILESSDYKINFDFEPKKKSGELPADAFAAKWTSVFRADEDCDLRVSIGGDDGYRLIINGSIVAQDWGKHAYNSKHISYPVKKGLPYHFTVEYFDVGGMAKVDMSVKKVRKEYLAEILKTADNVIIATGFDSETESEGFDRPFNLPQYEEALINQIASINPNVVVVVNSGGSVDTNPWLDNVKGLVMAWYPGQEGGQALAEILTGRISPSGKLPFTYYKSLEDSPAHTNYYDNRINVNNSISDEGGHVEYREGVFHGYRGSDLSGVRPLYPFGFGLGYSTFKFKDLDLTPVDKNKIRVSFDIENTGEMEASETAQVYVRDMESKVKQPLKALKGFEKVKLQPGESRRVEIILDEEAFSFFDIDSNDFIIEPGDFMISVGNSSENLPLSGSVTIK